MNPTYWTNERVAGILLVSSLLIGLIALMILVARGALPAFSAMLEGKIERMLPHAATFRLTTMMFTVSWLPQLVGFCLLALLLKESGDEYFGIVGFTLILVASILGILYSTFRMSIDPWTAQAVLETGNAPVIHEPFQDWISSTFKIGYLTHFTGVAALGMAILRTRHLASWAGQVAIGWSLLWLLGGLVGVGAPGIPLIMPAVIGVFLLIQG